MTGGGSGGHIYPLIAVAEEIKKMVSLPSLDLRYFGGAREFSSVLEKQGIRVVPIVSSKIRRYFSPANLLDVPKFFWGFFESLWKVYWFMPDVVFSKGGPGSLPVVLACRFYLIPLIVHESDSVPGLTNIISGKLAQRIFLAFSSAREYFKNEKKTELVGNPVRLELTGKGNPEFTEEERSAAKSGFGFDPRLPLLLVLGGSQGARRINNFILENLELLLRQFQILHQVGVGEYSAYKKEYEFLSKNWSELEKVRYQFRPYFSEDLRNAYLAADIVLARAGAGTIFELSFFAKPAILVPLPEAAGDHQTQNAHQYVHSGAAVTLEQENFLKEIVLDQLTQLIQNRTLLGQMSLSARSFYRPEAAVIIAKAILNYV